MHLSHSRHQCQGCYQAVDKAGASTYDQPTVNGSCGFNMFQQLMLVQLHKKAFIFVVQQAALASSHPFPASKCIVVAVEKRNLDVIHLSSVEDSQRAGSLALKTTGIFCLTSGRGPYTAQKEEDHIHERFHNKTSVLRWLPSI